MSAPASSSSSNSSDIDSPSPHVRIVFHNLNSFDRNFRWLRDALPGDVYLLAETRLTAPRQCRLRQILRRTEGLDLVCSGGLPTRRTPRCFAGGGSLYAASHAGGTAIAAASPMVLREHSGRCETWKKFYAGGRITWAWTPLVADNQSHVPSHCTFGIHLFCVYFVAGRTSSAREQNEKLADLVFSLAHEQGDAPVLVACDLSDEPPSTRLLRPTSHRECGLTWLQNLHGGLVALTLSPVEPAYTFETRKQSKKPVRTRIDYSLPTALPWPCSTLLLSKTSLLSGPIGPSASPCMPRVRSLSLA